MLYVSARRRLLAWEQKVKRKDLIEIWPVLRVSIERLILNETLGSVSAGNGSRYFDTFTKEKIFRLIGITAKWDFASDRSRVIFAIPDRLAERGDGAWNPYFGWIRLALSDESFSEFRIGGVSTLRELMRLLVTDFFPALWSLLISGRHATLIFGALRVATGKPVFWCLKGTVKVLLRLWCFKIFVLSLCS